MGGLKDMGAGIDKTFLLSSELKTTTADYTPVFGLPGTTDKTVHGILTESTDNLYPVGMLQGGQSANSVMGTVRVFGFSKAHAAAAITAFSPVTGFDASLGTSETGGKVSQFAHAAVSTDVTFAWSLGRAIEAAAATGDALTIFVNPQMSFFTA